MFAFILSFLYLFKSPKSCSKLYFHVGKWREHGSEQPIGRKTTLLDTILNTLRISHESTKKQRPGSKLQVKMGLSCLKRGRGRRRGARAQMCVCSLHPSQMPACRASGGLWSQHNLKLPCPLFFIYSRLLLIEKWAPETHHDCSRSDRQMIRNRYEEMISQAKVSGQKLFSFLFSFFGNPRTQLCLEKQCHAKYYAWHQG